MKNNQKPKKSMSATMKRRLKYGSFATVITCLFVVAVVIINIIAGALNNAFPLNIDLTPDSFFTTSDEAKDFAKGIDKDVTIYLLGTENQFADGSFCAGQTVYDLTPTMSYMSYIVRLVNDLSHISDKISVSYIDLSINPTFTSRFPNEELADGNIIVQCGEKYRMMTFFDLFNVSVTTVSNSYMYYITSTVAEKAFCSAITNVTSNEQKIISLITGHDDQDSNALVSMLQTNGYDVQTVNLVTGNIDQKSLFAILYAPNLDYSENELFKLDTYLTNGGEYNRNLIVFFGVNQTAELTNLDEFLADWGVSVGSDTIYETNSSKIMYGNGLSFLADYNDEAYGSITAEKGVYVLMTGARPVDTLFSNKNYITPTVLLSASESSVLMPSNADNTWTASQAEDKGPFAALVVSEKDPYNDPERTSRVFTCGTSYIAVKDALSNPSFANEEYVSHIFNYVTSNEQTVGIASKTVSSYTVNMTTGQSNAIGLVLFTIVTPLVMLGMGFYVYFRRRRL